MFSGSCFAFKNSNRTCIFFFQHIITHSFKSAVLLPLLPQTFMRPPHCLFYSSLRSSEKLWWWVRLQWYNVHIKFHEKWSYGLTTVIPRPSYKHTYKEHVDPIIHRACGSHKPTFLGASTKQFRKAKISFTTCLSVRLSVSTTRLPLDG